MQSLKFAVVREDPELESELIRASGAPAALVVASGGCTALTLKARFPEMEVVAFDANPRQLEHLGEKIEAVERGEWARLNVGDGNREGLNQEGDFEKLFRSLRNFWLEFLSSPEEVERFFSVESGEEEREAIRRRWFSNPYWAAAFEAFFNDRFLNAMFGPEATRHARKGSYPGYFQKVFEEGLSRPGAGENPFLEHILLGYYQRRRSYMRAKKRLEVELIEGSLLDVPDLGRFGVVSLSNIFDWSDHQVLESWGKALKEASRPGTMVLIRQLNNRRELQSALAPEFYFDQPWGEALRQRDRSLFYEKIIVGIRREDR